MCLYVLGRKLTAHINIFILKSPGSVLSWLGRQYKSWIDEMCTTYNGGYEIKEGFNKEYFSHRQPVKQISHFHFYRFALRSPKQELSLSIFSFFFFGINYCKKMDLKQNIIQGQTYRLFRFTSSMCILNEAHRRSGPWCFKKDWIVHGVSATLKMISHQYA